MARMRQYDPSKLGPCRTATPHSVALVYDDHDARAALRWIRMPEQKGEYRYDEGAFRTVYWFSDENTAFAFKMKFG